MVDGIALGYNIIVKIVIRTSRLLILPFHTYEGFMNCLILVRALCSINKLSIKNSG